MDGMKRVVVAVGRFNPPTLGHKKLFDKVLELSSGGDYVIMPSRTIQNHKNPLSFERKVYWLERLFPAISFFVKEDIKNIIDLLIHLNGKYNDLIYICGNDRILEFSLLIHKYNGSLYLYDSIDIVSSGCRGGENISASNAREFVKNRDLQSFSYVIPGPFQKELYEELLRSYK